MSLPFFSQLPCYERLPPGPAQYYQWCHSESTVRARQRSQSGASEGQSSKEFVLELLKAYERDVCGTAIRHQDAAQQFKTAHAQLRLEPSKGFLDGCPSGCWFPCCLHSGEGISADCLMFPT